jgi:hypothetical protein
MLALLIICNLLGWTKTVHSWGADVHPTIGYLAERYLLDDTVDYLSYELITENPNCRDPRE